MTLTQRETPSEDDAEVGDADEVGEQLDEDAIFDVLSERRRRDAIGILDELDGGPVGAREIADRIATDEADSIVREEDEKRVYVALYQCHLPKLEDADVVEWDRDAKMVAAGRYFDEVAELRRYVDEDLGAGTFKRLWSVLR